jgi:hypothetical protein
MLKASALYIVIVIALVIGLICSSLIVTAYYYRAEYHHKSRYNLLQNNLGSGINILLATQDTAYLKEKKFSLFGNDNDTVSLQRHPWGVFTIGIAKAIIQQDTLYKTFSIANTIDSSKWAALYLIDEDRPVSVSGQTTIRGDAYLPKAGITQAYIDGKAYTGDKRLVIGKKYQSNKSLPPLDTDILRQLNVYFTANGSATIAKDSTIQSFLQPTKIFDFGKEVKTLERLYLKGNIIIHADTTLIIDSTVNLDNVLVFAKGIIIKGGFTGRCQLFATDSISIGPTCKFNYPSSAGIIRFAPPIINSQAKITMGVNTTFAGLIFTYEKKPSDYKPLISIGKQDTLKGQLYAQDILDLNDRAVIAGSAFTSRFRYKNAFTLYENYLINVTIDSKALSPYYLSSPMIPVSSKKKKILQWLEGNRILKALSEARPLLK